LLQATFRACRKKAFSLVQKEKMNGFTDLVEELLTIASIEWTSSFSSILTFLGALIVSVIIAQIFVRIFKSKLLGFLVASACSI